MKDYSIINGVLNIDHYSDLYTSIEFGEDETRSEACAYRDNFILINYVFSNYPEPYLKVYDITLPIYNIYRISLLEPKYLENKKLSKLQKDLFIKALSSSPQATNGTMTLFSKIEQNEIQTVWDLIIHGMNRERELFGKQAINNIPQPNYSKLETVD